MPCLRRIAETDIRINAYPLKFYEAQKGPDQPIGFRCDVPRKVHPLFLFILGLILCPPTFLWGFLSAWSLTIENTNCGPVAVKKTRIDKDARRLMFTDTKDNINGETSGCDEQQQP